VGAILRQEFEDRINGGGLELVGLGEGIEEFERGDVVWSEGTEVGAFCVDKID